MLRLIQGDAIEQLRTLQDESVHCCVTSPPYWGLRDYGTAAWEGGDEFCDHAEPPRGGRNPETAGKQLTNTGTLAYQYAQDCGKCGAKRIDSQLGLEKTPEEYVAKMVEVFREVRRVLRKDGTLWLNLGDSYNNRPWGDSATNFNDPKRGKDNAGNGVKSVRNVLTDTLKPKDLCGIPWRVAFALQADGWWLRSDIIWSKPNPMPESVTDRPTKSHEYLFLLTKSANYFYDAEAIKEAPTNSTLERDQYTRANYAKDINDGFVNRINPDVNNGFRNHESGRNKRSVWNVATAPYPEAHFATYPPDLIKPCIMAGTSAKGCCAKCGAPWERVVDVSYEHINFTTPRQHSSYVAGTSGQVANKRCKTLGWQPTCACYGRFEEVEREVERAKGSVPDGWMQSEGGHNTVKYSGRERSNNVAELSATITKRQRIYVPTSESQPVPCTVLDPFAGSGTTGAVALELGRKAILIELNPKYAELINERCNITPGLALA